MRPLLIALPLILGACVSQPDKAPEKLPTRIAFGSCSHQEKPMPILDQVIALNPDLFIYLGDNIYGDTEDMEILKAKYQTLGAREEFQRLKQSTPLLATWDDHDYGRNDAGKEYPKKAESKEILNFWDEPLDSERRQHEGIYTSYHYQKDGKRLQIILLDTRTFRDPLLRKNGQKGPYIPHPETGSTMLGDAQWRWLEAQLQQPADLRIIGSSTQFAHQHNGHESWTNLPFEQQRMIDLIQHTKANGVLFITGDVHWGEISKRPVDGGYDLIDITASGINRDWKNVSPNKYRVGSAVREFHFGIIDIDWSEKLPQVECAIYDFEGTKREALLAPASQLQFKGQ